MFFNHWHNGDIHLSRGFVRKIMEKLHSIDPQTTFAYSHRNDPNLLMDIPNLGFDPLGISQISAHDGVVKKGDTLYINTWYAQQNYKYMNTYGITMDTLYIALDESCRNVWGFSLSDISQDPSIFYPSIDYSKFEITSITNWLQQHPDRKIFISNGRALSDQADYFNLTNIINQVALKHLTTTFILSNQESPITTTNVIYSSSIIKKSSGSDLNENAFLSEHCDVIIGRSSGAFTFAMTQNNMYNRKVKFLDFSSLTPKKPGQYWLNYLLQDKIKFWPRLTVSIHLTLMLLKN